MAGRTTVRYRPNPSFDREAEKAVLYRQGVALVAGEIASRASAASPKGFMGLARSIRAGGDGEVFAGPGWHLVEFGSVHSAPRALFRRTLDQLGIGLEPSR